MDTVAKCWGAAQGNWRNKKVLHSDSSLFRQPTSTDGNLNRRRHSRSQLCSIESKAFRATITLYPIGRPVRATITLYPIGRPVRATITLYHIGRPVRATITLYPIVRPVRATITLYPIGRPIRATITLYHIGRPVRATITLYPIGRCIFHIAYNKRPDDHDENVV